MLTSKSVSSLAVLFLCLLAVIPAGLAQSNTGTLTGIVQDSTQAVVPNAAITLKNESSGDIRKSETNADGYFTIAALQAGTYTLSVDAPGFIKWERTGIQFNGADKRTVNDIVLQIGATSEKVEVTSSVEMITPVDSGEKSAVLTTNSFRISLLWAAAPPNSLRFCPAWPSPARAWRTARISPAK